MNDITSPNPTPSNEFCALAPDELIARLEQEGDRASKELFDACVAHGEAMVQALAAKIDDEATWNTDSYDAWWLPYHAALILGRIASESSGFLLLDLMRRIDNLAAEDLQDWLAGDWAALFENKPPGVIAAVRDLVTNTALNWHTRCQGVDVLLDSGLRQGAEALDTEIDWVAGLVSDKADEWPFRIAAACTLLDFPRQRHRSLLDSMAVEETLIAKSTRVFAGMFDLANVESAFTKNLDEPGWKRRDNPWTFYHPDAIAARQERWCKEDAQAPLIQHLPAVEFPQVRTEPKIGRNDPCPCGSGRKFKKCCLDKQSSTSSSGELAWRRIRRELEGLSGRMLRFAAATYGHEAVHEAWREFMLWDEDEAEFDDESPHAAVFLPWMLHHWSPNPDETDVADTRLHQVAPTRAYLERKGRQLSSLIREYLQSCLDQPFSFYEVEHVEPGRGMALRDLLTDEHHDVYERGASQSVAVHEVIYAQLASVDGITLIEALCPVSLSPGDKVPVITLRERMRRNEADHTDLQPDAEALRMWEFELRELYLSLSERYMYPSLPELQTSDGETLEFHTLVYDIDSAQTAFDALSHLNPMASNPAESEPNFRRDDDGLVQHAQINWVRADQDSDATSSTLLGSITIDNTRLTATVNSRERAERLKTIIGEKLAAHATFRADKIQTPEQAMAENTPPSPRLPQDSPEAQAFLVDYLRKHYERWIDMPLPALANCSPRDAVNSPAGCEKVEALLLEAEQHDLNLPAATRKIIFDTVRLQLGLET